MKLYVTLIITAIFMAFLTGFYAISWRGNYKATASDILKISKVKLQFVETVKPKSIINFKTLYSTTAQRSLLDPLKSVQRSEEILNKRIYSTDQNCFSSVSGLINLLKETKVLIWEEFRCKYRKKLPINFFENGPFLHSSMISYAYLAYLSGDIIFQSEQWLLENIQFFHASELRALKKFKEFDGVYGVIQDLDDNSLLDLLNGKEYLYSENYFLAKIIYKEDLNFGNYILFLRTELEKYLKAGPFEIVSLKRDGKECFFKEGNICWQYNVGYLLKNSDKANILFFIVCFMFVFIIAWTLIHKIRAQKADEERKKFALRVLTHEFRTPIASLLLQLERIQKRFSDLGEDMQEAFLRFSNDVYRLQRLTEASRNYLQTKNNNKLVQTNVAEINSINDYIKDQMGNFLDKCELELLEVDSSFLLDSYWVGICLKNILDNANIHGVPPIKIKISLEGRDGGLNKLQKKNLVINIQDSGVCQFNDIQELTTEFLKGDKSEGTGLGLNIVKRAIEELGGSISFKNNPTTFILKIPFLKRDRFENERNITY